MIVQTAPAGLPHFIIWQHEHARMSGQLAQQFGNAQFHALAPRDLVKYIVAHHDEGWREIDAAQTLDPRTHLPYHLTQTPLAQIIQTGSRSPAFNERHHPLCGLLSSMHTYGLYHGRYGLSDKIFINNISAEMRGAVEGMLAGELERQARLKHILAQDAATRAWVDEQHLFHNYKLLQFFDTLALYFHTTHESQRGQAQFLNVPRAVGEDVTVTISPNRDGTYALSPYPFAVEKFSVRVNGKYLMPLAEGADAQAALHAAEDAAQEYVIVKA